MWALEVEEREVVIKGALKQGGGFEKAKGNNY